MLKRSIQIVLALVGVLLLVVVGVVGFDVLRFRSSTQKVYDIPVPELSASSDPAIIERGRHLVQTVGGCAASDCHGADFGGTDALDLGPLGHMTGPNLTQGGRGAEYSDGEIARVILHGVKRDGRTVLFMPAHEINWLPDEDIVAILSYVRSMPPVERTVPAPVVGLLGKVLDRHDLIRIDIARRIDHSKRETAPPPEPTALYGAFLARSCTGCHGENLSGGKIPGAPAEMAIPANLTPDATGLGEWTFADFEHLLATGRRPDGRELDPFMPVESLNRMNDVEKRALWAYLRGLEPRPFGGR